MKKVGLQDFTVVWMDAYMGPAALGIKKSGEL